MKDMRGQWNFDGEKEQMNCGARGRVRREFGNEREALRDRSVISGFMARNLC
jgi:hypothetical protein